MLSLFCRPIYCYAILPFDYTLSAFELKMNSSWIYSGLKYLYYSILLSQGELGRNNRWARTHQNPWLLLEDIFQVLQPMEVPVLLPHDPLLLMLCYDGMGLLLRQCRIQPCLDPDTNDPCLRAQHCDGCQDLRYGHSQYYRPNGRIIRQVLRTICKVESSLDQVFSGLLSAMRLRKTEFFFIDCSFLISHCWQSSTRISIHRLFITKYR